MLPVFVRQRDDATVVIRIRGELDDTTCGEIESTIRSATKLWARIVVDGNAVTFCGSAGLRMLLRCADAATEHGGTFAITEPSPRLARVLDITGLTRLLDT